MRYVEALEEYQPQPGDPPALFVAGGIRHCADWQTSYCKLFADTPLILLNPRRVLFDGSPTASAQQVEWEFRHLRKATAISFWFAVETLNPITLFELGAWSNSKQPIYVGCHPQYQKRRTVTKQLELLRPEVKVVNSLELLAAEVRHALFPAKNVQPIAQ